MRYRLIVFLLLVLFAVLPVINVLAAPAPEPSAILDIGPPAKGMTAEEYSRDRIHGLTSPDGILWHVKYSPAVRNLPSVSRLKDALPWLEKNLRVKEEDGGRRLRLTFRAGTRAEQVAILNELLRIKLRAQEASIKFQEKCLRSDENIILDLEKRIASGQHPESVDSYRKGINEIRLIRIPETRAEIARRKQLSVVKWAR